MTPASVCFPTTVTPVAKTTGALTAEEIERVLSALRSLVQQYGGQTDLERATSRRLRQQVISRYLANPPQGRPGYAFAQHVADALGLGVEELLGRQPIGEPTLAMHPDWSVASAQAIADEPDMEDRIRAVGRIRVPDEITLTPEFVLAMAYSYSRGKPRPKGGEPRKK